MKLTIAALLALLVLQAGCMGDEKESSPTSGTPSIAPTPTDCRNEDSQGCASRPSVGPAFQGTLHDCNGFLNTLNTPRAVFEPEYPPGVTSSGSTNTDIPFIEVWSCRQAIIAGVIQDNFTFAVFAGDILNPFPGRELNVTSAWYGWQYYTSSPKLRDEAEKVGLSIQLVEAITLERLVVITQTPGASTYEVRIPKAASPDYRLTGSAYVSGGAWDSVRGYYFLNSTGLSHLRMEWKGGNTGGQPCTVAFGPNSYWKQRSEVDSWECLNAYAYDASATLEFFPPLI